MRRYKVRILPSAQNDLVLARNWYKQHNPGLPKRFIQQVNLSVERIREAPFVYAVRYEGVRIANINIFPYAIHYFIDELTSVVVIISLFHLHRKPFWE